VTVTKSAAEKPRVTFLPGRPTCARSVSCIGAAAAAIPARAASRPRRRNSGPAALAGL
jgi:hypothetical protein